MAKLPTRPKPRAVGDVHLRVVRGPRDDGRWYWRARRFSAGTETAVWAGWGTVAEADTTVASLVARGPEAKRDPDRPDTVRDLCELYLGRQAGRADLTPQTIHTLRNIFRRVLAIVGDVKIDRLDGAALERYRDTRLRASGAPASIRAELIRLRAAWTWGQEREIVPFRPLARCRVTPRRVNNDVTPERADVVKVLAQLDGWMRVAVLLYAVTGARLGELAPLTWADVDLDHGLLRVSGKTGPREVPLAAGVAEMLIIWRDRPLLLPDPRVFPVGVGTVKAKVLPALAKACAAAKVARFTAQGLRRAAVDLLYRGGADIQSAAAVVGHSPAVALQSYRSATLADRRKAVALAGLGADLVAADRHRKPAQIRKTPGQRTEK